MRPGDARSGQLVAVLISELDKKLEGVFLYEDSDTSVIAINVIGIGEGERARFGTPVAIEGFASDTFVFIEVETAALYPRVPTSWGQDFTPITGAGRPVPPINLLMQSYDTATHVESEVDPEAQATPAAAEPPAGGPPRQAQGGVASRPPAGLNPVGATPLAAAGIGRRQMGRIASLYEDDLDDEEDEEGPTEYLPPPRRPARETRTRTPLDRLLEESEHAAAGGALPDTSALVQLEMLRMLRGMRDEDRRRQGPDGEDLFADEDRPATSLGKAVAGMTRHRDRMKSRPRAIVEQFREDCRDELAVRSDEPWSYPDMARRIEWGQYRGMQRSYILIMHVIELLDRGETMRAHALACQSAKAFHQVALSGGQWKVAWALTGLPDPLTRKRFAGTATELEAVADFVKAEEELDKKSRGGMTLGQRVKEDGDEADDAPPPYRSAAAKKKAFDKRKKKEAGEGA